MLGFPPESRFVYPFVLPSYFPIPNPHFSIYTISLSLLTQKHKNYFPSPPPPPPPPFAAAAAFIPSNLAATSALPPSPSAAHRADSSFAASPTLNPFANAPAPRCSLQNSW